jgi:hypothetical protein
VTEYRAGQRVRVEWPNGDAVEGTIMLAYGVPILHVEPAARGPLRLDQRGPDDGRTVTILPSPPSPPPPTGAPPSVYELNRDALILADHAYMDTPGTAAAKVRAAVWAYLWAAEVGERTGMGPSLSALRDALSEATYLYPEQARP